jgi:hypothetical protein
MRRVTAVRRLAAIAAECQRLSELWHDDRSALVAAYAFGDLIDGAPEVDVVQVAFVLNLPADELTWGAEPPAGASLIHVLGLDKAPVEWYWRPSEWPVANHVIRRPLEIWSAEHGVQELALEALDRGTYEAFRLPPPPPDEARRQLATELEACLAHLRAVEASYWEPDWRRRHRGGGSYPENHLWGAVHGYLDLLSASQDRSGTNGAT